MILDDISRNRTQKKIALFARNLRLKVRECYELRDLDGGAKILDPAVHGRGRRRLRCACWWRTSIMGGYYVSMNASCADDQNFKIVRCSTFQGR